MKHRDRTLLVVLLGFEGTSVTGVGGGEFDRLPKRSTDTDWGR